MSSINREVDELDFPLNKNLSTQNALSTSRPLLHRRSSSTLLFAKPTPLYTKEESNGQVSLGHESMKRRGNIFDTTIHQSHELGVESSDIEVTFRNECEASEMQSVDILPVDEDPISGFIDGDFSYGKVKDIELPACCYVMKFNVDSTILAVGLNDGKGVALYESQTFTLLQTLDRRTTVSALDWVPNPFTEDFENSTRLEKIDDDDDDDDDPINRSSKRLFTRSQYLAVGGFDGVVTVYEISLEGLMNGVVSIICDIRVKSVAYDVAFLKDNGSLYVPEPLALVIGEMNGRVSVFEMGGFEDELKLKAAVRKIDNHKSPVLSLTFGFEQNSMVLVCGTKEGLIRASTFTFDETENHYYLSSKLFEFQRTGAIRCLRFNHDSGILIAGGYDKTVAVIDTVLWKIVREIYVDGTVNTLEFDPMHKFLMLGTRSKDLVILDTSTYQEIKVLHASSWVTAISWAVNSTVAIRSDEKVVSLIKLEAIHSLELKLASSRGEECCISWSHNGRFMARTQGNSLLLIDAKTRFEQVAKLSSKDTIRGVKFSTTKGYRNRFAMVGYDGYLSVYIIRTSQGSVKLEKHASVFLEKNLCSVAWSPDASALLAGGRGMNLYVISSSTYLQLCKPLPTDGRIRLIDCLSQVSHSQMDDYANSFSIAVAMGRSYAGIYDLKTFERTMDISRKRTVRCLCYHPSLPILAIGDGGNNVVIVDLAGERQIAQFSVGGRVNSISFSPAGDFIAVGSDNCTFTLHETVTFKVVQEIPGKGFASSVAFSGSSGQYLAIAYAFGQTEIFKLGPLLSIDLVPLDKKSALSDLPEWAYKETVHRSPEGMSFLQRCILEGSQESLMHAESILNDSPEAMLTFNRYTGIGCFETAVQLRKPTAMRLIMKTCVDGTLGKRQLSNSMITTTMPMDGLVTLINMIEHHPPEYATEILSKMTFIKVPFSEARPCTISKEYRECGSSSFTDPWDEKELRKKTWNGGNKEEIYLVPAVLPLPCLGTLAFLSAVTSNMGPDIYDNDAMGLVLRVMWDSGIKQYFWFDFTLYVIFFICWIFLVDTTSSSTSSSTTPLIGTTSWAHLLPWIILGLNSVFLLEQTVRYRRSGRQLFRSMWNFIDLICIALVYLYALLVVMDNRGTGHGSVTIAVITTLAITMRFISLLRGFDRTGWLVSVLTQNFIDARGFGFILSSILAGFTVSFRLLFANVPGECPLEMNDNGELEPDCDKDPFGDLLQSLLSTFEMTILGSYDPQILRETQDQILAAVIFVLAVTVVLVVVLNALIAVLGDSFSRVQESATANRRRERAELIVGYLAMMPSKQRKEIELNTLYFHTLLETDGHGEFILHKGEWQGGLNLMKKRLGELGETNKAQTQRTLDQLRKELTEEFEKMLKNEVSSVLNNIALDVKGISQIHHKNGIAAQFARNVPIQSMQKIGKTLPAYEGIRKVPLIQKENTQEIIDDDLT